MLTEIHSPPKRNAAAKKYMHIAHVSSLNSSKLFSPVLSHFRVKMSSNLILTPPALVVVPRPHSVRKGDY